MIQPERVKPLNSKPIGRSDTVVYWMQASQREAFNHALEFAVEKANSLNKTMEIYFGLTEHFPGANLRSYKFMLDGLCQTCEAVQERGIRFNLEIVSPEKGIVEFARNKAMVVVDRGYTRVQKLWRDYAARNLPCQLVQVESDVIVPVEIASTKEEYSAATLRPKIRKHLDKFLVPLRRRKLKIPSSKIGHSYFTAKKLLDNLKIDRSVSPSKEFMGGYKEAKRWLQLFMKRKLENYAENRNNPAADVLSNLSPYLHFGQISPLEIALEVSQTNLFGADVYLEELIIRRELAINFVNYNKEYDNFHCLPGWCNKTLIKHKSDPRPYVYGLEALENAETHDEIWNMAQIQMVTRGKMHGYLRMYWGKKILEWNASPEEAFAIAVYLNDKYELDGRDPNGYAGVAWCFGKHDRPWPERPIFGTVRYMSYEGLKRKFRRPTSK